MDLRKDYEELYQHWLTEFQNTELTELNQENFKRYMKYLNYINSYQEEGNSEVKAQILKSYKDNLNYLLNDFLKIREIKIINSALALKEINLDKVTEAEKLLYENLVSSIKGYKKVKAISLYEEEKVPIDRVIEPTTEVKPGLEEVAIPKEGKIPEIIDAIKKNEKEEINYMLVRFLKKTPPLVGIDLINYGPFEEEDMAHLPQKNAKILIIENFAEEIKIN
jgi:DNA replication initiation complex subunit (GINS family)